MATDTEQRYLSAMASLGEGPYPVGEVAQAFGVNDQRRVSMHREGLIQKGLIWSPRRGRVDFTVPLFAEFLRENHSLA
jgi:Mn-dependent DtxR family transcriptional regulator